MRCKLLKSINEWMEDVEKSKKPSFGDWMTREFGVEDKDFADIGDIWLANTLLKPDGSDEEIEIKRPTLFTLSRNDDGTVYKLVVQGKPDPSDPRKAAFPHAAESPYHGKEFTLTKDEYEKLIMPVARQGGGPGLGLGI